MVLKGRRYNSLENETKDPQRINVDQKKHDMGFLSHFIMHKFMKQSNIEQEWDLNDEY